MIDDSVLYQETLLNYFHYLALHRLKISNKTDRRVKECVRKTLDEKLDDVWGKGEAWNWQKQPEKYSQNTSWFGEQTAEAFTPSVLSEMTSHTPIMPALPASAVWGIYGPLWALIHSNTHTWCEVRRVSAAWTAGHSEFKLTHSRATGFIRKWHISDLN